MKVKFLLLSLGLFLAHTCITTLDACPTSFCEIDGCEETDECCELEE